MAREHDDSHWDFDRNYERDNLRERRPLRRVVDEPRPLAARSAVQDSVAVTPAEAAGTLNPPIKLDRCRICFVPVHASGHPNGTICKACAGES